MRVPRKETDLHKKRLEVIKLVHEVVHCVSKIENHLALVKILDDRVTITDPVRVHNNMIGQYHLGPLNELPKGTIDLLNFLS
jgi:hypothetical protein